MFLYIKMVTTYKCKVIFKIFLINTFNGEKKRIDVEREEYRKIKEKGLIKNVYFDKVNISMKQ